MGVLAMRRDAGVSTLLIYSIYVTNISGQYWKPSMPSWAVQSASDGTADGAAAFMSPAPASWDGDDGGGTIRHSHVYRSPHEPGHDLTGLSLSLSLSLSLCLSIYLRVR
jgi:hypothetical protein